MKFTHYIYIVSALVAFSACSDDITTPAYTVGEADNVIMLSAGISEGGNGVATRAGAAGGYDDIDASNHTKHLAFTNGTQAALRIDGTWLGHSPVAVSLPTTATISAETATDSKHNSVTLSPDIYWDDFGTADPANMNPNSGNGRAIGLTIYGAAVNGVTNAPSIDGTTGKQWAALSWNVGTPSGTPSIIDQSGTDYWKNQDLLTTNNVRTGGPDDTYKFDEKASGKLLEFTHAMTKITVNLTAGEGFADGKFVSQPTVTLLNFNYTGNVNIEAKTSTPTASSITNFQAHFANYKETNAATEWTAASSTWISSNQTQFDALVFPGNTFADATDILKIEADGNTYYVNATKINEANMATGDVFEQAKNYVFNIKVNKTKIVVEATIKDWVDVEAEEVAPEINVTATYGQTVAADGSNAFTKSYDFFRSTSIASGYDDDSNTNGINPASTYTYNSGTGTWDKVLFWPNHDTHYFFRGVYPTIGTESSGLASSTNLAISTADSKEFIEVSNAAYTVDTWPSDLAIALPRTTNTACTNHSKTPLENGICATKGVITMNFEYAMSKVEVRLKSSDNTSDEEYVNLGNITVEVVGGYKQGRISMSDGLHDAYTDADKGDYTLTPLASAVSGFQKTTLDAIVPQELSDDVKFKITVTNSDNTKDIYYAQLNKIKVKTADDSGALITEWKHGVHYIYELKVTKSQINVTATLTDWITVTASQPVWF